MSNQNSLAEKTPSNSVEAEKNTEKSKTKIRSRILMPLVIQDIQEKDKQHTH